jgi:hypothetical protein
MEQQEGYPVASEQARWLSSLMACTPGEDGSRGPIARSRSDTPKRNPATHELEEGVAFINEHAPDCDGRNEQTLWILISRVARTQGADDGSEQESGRR